MNKKEYSFIDIYKFFKRYIKTISLITLFATLIGIVININSQKVFETKVRLAAAEYYSTTFRKSHLRIDMHAQEVEQILKSETTKDNGWLYKVESFPKNKIVTIISRGFSAKVARQSAEKTIRLIKNIQDKELEILIERRRLTLKHKRTLHNHIKDRIIHITDEIETSKIMNSNLRKVLKDLSNRSERYKTESVQKFIAKMQESTLKSEIFHTSQNIIKKQDELYTLKTLKIPQLEEEIQKLDFLTNTDNFKPTKIIGKFESRKNPISPNYSVQIPLYFTLGLFLSLFFVFFRETIIAFKDSTSAD